MSTNALVFIRRLGRWLGPLAALITFAALPEMYADATGQVVPLSDEARTAAAVAVWMAVWWMTEAIPVYATALLPLTLFPLTGVATVKQTAASYGHELVFLFLGGFVLALALERWGVHRRLALAVLGVVGNRPARVIGSFMLIAAFTSMWVTNTATTIMLLPVALSVLGLVQEQSGAVSRFGICLLLGIAYAASIGGIGTIVGTAPNLFLVSFIEQQMGVTISFARWMLIGVPLVAVFVPLCWLVLTRFVFCLPKKPLEGMAEAIALQRQDLKPFGQAEQLTLTVFVLTAGAWVCRPLLSAWTVNDWQPFAGLTDPGIAIAAALALFVIPAGRGQFLMDWATASRLPWGLLILFGGGLSLAAAIDGSGLSAFLGAQASALGGLPMWVVVALVVALMILLTEMTSNTATTATLIPVLYAVAIGLRLDPLMIIVPAGIAASCAFMLPVATPPNAIVFGSGHIPVYQMTRAGWWLNCLGICLITLLTYVLAMPVLAGLT